jgi:hypothetical protein
MYKTEQQYVDTTGKVVSLYNETRNGRKFKSKTFSIFLEKPNESLSRLSNMDIND